MKGQISSPKSPSPQERMAMHWKLRFGRNVDQELAQYILFHKMCLSWENSGDPHKRSIGEGFFSKGLPEDLVKEFRNAIASNDGSFFRRLANHIDASAPGKYSKAAVWVTGALFEFSRDNSGHWTTEQPHKHKTAEVLWRQCKKDTESNGDGGTKIGLNEFRRMLRQYGAIFAKKRVGRPKIQKLRQTLKSAP